VIETFRLSNRLAIPVQSELFQIASLCRFVLSAGGSAIEILEPKKKLTSDASGAEPRNERRAQVADVERAGWAGSETSATHRASLA